VNNQQLLIAQNKARHLLKEIEARKLIAIGLTEKKVTDHIYDLAFELYGTKKHWHKRIVRTGINSVHSFKENPPNLTIQENDLVYLDLGPVFDEYEGDIGKTYLLGSDPKKRKLINDLERIFVESKSFYLERPSMTGAELWSHVQDQTKNAGWLYGSHIAGHVIGEFSHVQKYGDAPEARINQFNKLPMNLPDSDGNKRHWILEIHLVDQNKTFGGFYEDLLSL